jgi:hypothetical protein
MKLLNHIPGTHEEFPEAYMTSTDITDMPAPIPIKAATIQSETGSSTSHQFGRSSSTNVNAYMNVDTPPKEEASARM